MSDISLFIWYGALTDGLENHVNGDGNTAKILSDISLVYGYNRMSLLDFLNRGMERLCKRRYRREVDERPEGREDRRKAC